MKTLAENECLELVGDIGYRNRESLLVHHKWHADARAAFAMEMIRAWGLVAGRHAVAGEIGDDRGIVLMPVEDVVNRACLMAETAFSQFRDKGWILDLPKAADVIMPED